jgi:hypothetical protein
MFPQHVTEVLQQLSYVAIIICSPAVIYFFLKAIVLEIRFDNHEKTDLNKHTEIDRHLGKHDSQIFDLQMDSATKGQHNGSRQ